MKTTITILITIIVNLFSTANAYDLIKEVQTLFVFDDYHLHRAEIFFEAYDTSGPWQDDYFSADIYLRHAPNGDYQQNEGTLVDADGAWMPMTDENGDWQKYIGTLAVSYTDPEANRTYCSKTIYERYPSNFINPQPLEWPDYRCSSSPQICIHRNAPAKYQNSKLPICDPIEDPLIIDLGRDGINLGPKGRAVKFDYNGDSQYKLSQWVAVNGNEAFLALDQNHNGIVDDGTELFGRGWLHLEETLAEHGFEQLAQYDQPLLGGNGDGIISPKDNIWQQLSLWLDSNADGISTKNEMMSLAEYQLTKIKLDYKIRPNRTDKAGNEIPYWSKALGAKKHQVVDVFFKILESKP